MVDGIDANRKKWQDLHVSYQQTRRASLPSQGGDTPVLTPESPEHAKASQQQAQDTKSTAEVEWLRCDVQPALVGHTTETHQSTAGWLLFAGLFMKGLTRGFVHMHCATFKESVNAKSCCAHLPLEGVYALNSGSQVIPADATQLEGPFPVIEPAAPPVYLSICKRSHPPTANLAH